MPQGALSSQINNQVERNQGKSSVADLLYKLEMVNLGKQAAPK